MSHLEKELQLNGLEAPDELQVNTVTQQATQQNSEKPEATCHHYKKPSHYQNQCRQLKREKHQARNITNTADSSSNNIGNSHTNLTPTKKFPTIPMQAKQIIKKTEDLDLSTLPVRPVVEITTPQSNVTLEQMQRTDRLPGTDDRKDKIKPHREIPKATQMAVSKLQPKL